MGSKARHYEVTIGVSVTVGVQSRAAWTALCSRSAFQMQFAKEWFPVVGRTVHVCVRAWWAIHFNTRGGAWSLCLIVCCRCTRFPARSSTFKSQHPLEVSSSLPGKATHRLFLMDRLCPLPWGTTLQFCFASEQEA